MQKHVFGAITSHGSLKVEQENHSGNFIGMTFMFFP
jgi:hypothetical protein